MQSTKHEKKLGREKLERIVEMCVAIESHVADPFTLNIDDIIKVVKEYFPHWEHPEELKLDAETLHHLASVTSTIRDVPSEVVLTEEDGMKGPCAVNLHNAVTISQDRLGRTVGGPTLSQKAIECQKSCRLMEEVWMA